MGNFFDLNSGLSKPFGFFFLAVFAGGLISCDKSASTQTQSPDAESSSSVAEEPPVAPEEAAPNAAAESESAEPPPEFPLLDVLENEKEKRIVVSGHLSSPAQGEDLIAAIKAALPEFEVVNEFQAHPSLRLLVWGYRIDAFVLPFLKGVENAHFHYENGVTTLGGTVDSKKTAGLVQKMAINIMEAPDFEGLQNNLQAKEE